MIEGTCAFGKPGSVSSKKMVKVVRRCSGGGANRACVAGQIAREVSA